MIGAILFDVDGTLVDSNELHVDAWVESFRDFGFDISAERVRGQIGKGGDNLIPTLLPELPNPKREELDRARGELFKRDYLDRVRPFPGVRQLFERLQADGIKVVLASSAGKEELQHHVDLLDCADLLAATTSRDDVEHSKPCPDIFAAALGKVPPLVASEVMAIGDSPFDVEAARKLDIEVIGLRSGGFPENDLLGTGATLVFDDIEDLTRHYERIFAPAAVEA